MIYFLLSILLFTIGCTSLHQFVVEGEKPFCVVNYNKKEINCIYNSMYDCRMHYDSYESEICFPNKFTKKP